MRPTTPRATPIFPRRSFARCRALGHLAHRGFPHGLRRWLHPPTWVRGPSRHRPLAAGLPLAPRAWLGPGDPSFPKRGPPTRPDRPKTPEGRPEDQLTRGSGDTLFEVDDRDGLLEPFEEREDTVAYVMMGNPRLLQAPSVDKDGKTIPGLEIKGHLFVIWVRKNALPGLGGLMGDAPAAENRASAPPGRRSTSVVPDDVREIYAEGAVEVTYDDLTFKGRAALPRPASLRRPTHPAEVRGAGHGRALWPASRFPSMCGRNVHGFSGKD